ncbi:MAG: c-type cytochrome domain-containing protein [Planctomycetota bacterium]|nr:c-type cytochrome domain-containing protein [Planctomycetota bacterium]
MTPKRFLCPLGCALALLAGACSNGSTTAENRADLLTLRRVAGRLPSGGAFGLAAALLAGDVARPGGTGAKLPPIDAVLARELVLTASGALRFLTLESGAGIDPVWSPLVAELSQRSGAPGDDNKNGTNRDETLTKLRDRFVFRSNAPVPAGLGQGFVLPTLLPDRLAGTPASRTDAKGLRLSSTPATDLNFTPGDVGAAILALTRRAAGLLSFGRGDLYGRTPEEGMRGLLLLEKAIAAERLMIQELAFDGATVGGIADPQAYDPAKNAIVFPARISYTLADEGPGLPQRPSFYLKDRGSNLIDQARLLRGFAELAWLASPQQPNHLLRRLFEGDPFGKGPQALNGNSDEGSGTGQVSPVAEAITWNTHLKGLLAGSCSGSFCHNPGNQGGFSVKDYASVLAGGDHASTNPTVVKTQSAQSLLWQITALAKPPVSRRMPDGGPYLSKASTDLIAEWIDTGALEKDPNKKQVDAKHGLDGVVVVVRNLVTQHLDSKSGALIDRADLTGPGVLVMADSAGEALQALAGAHEASPQLAMTIEPVLRSHATFVAEKLVALDGTIHESYRIDTDELATAPASIGGAAAVVAGLFEAARVLDSSALENAAERAGKYLLRYLDGRPRTFVGARSSRITPADAARLFEAFSAWYARTNNSARLADVEQLYLTLRSAGIVLSEWPATGEVFADGNPDTDGDGVVEVGTGSLPPLFANALENGAQRAGLDIPTRRVHYSRDVLPLLILHCADCHTGGANQGEFQCDTWGDLLRGGAFRDQMKIVVPADPAASLFWRKVEDRFPPFGVQMPENRPPMSPTARRIIKLWIEQGAIKD